MALKLTIYDIIKGPVISDKAYKLNRLFNQLELKVHIDATKPMIKQALEKLFNVKVKSVRTLISKYTTGGGAMKRKYAARPKLHEEKRAIITLAEGYTLNLFEQIGTSQTPVEQAKKAHS